MKDLAIIIGLALCIIATMADLRAGSIAPQPHYPPATTAGTDSLTGSATTKSVAMSVTMPDASYHVNVICVSDGQGAVSWQVGNRTTTTFNVTVSANSGTLAFTYQTVDY